MESRLRRFAERTGFNLVRPPESLSKTPENSGMALSEDNKVVFKIAHLNMAQRQDDRTRLRDSR
jgi:hypothetical protein